VLPQLWVAGGAGGAELLRRGKGEARREVGEGEPVARPVVPCDPSQNQMVVRVTAAGHRGGRQQVIVWWNGETPGLPPQPWVTGGAGGAKLTRRGKGTPAAR
jgi:hypothetical protein